MLPRCTETETKGRSTISPKSGDATRWRAKSYANAMSYIFYLLCADDKSYRRRYLLRCEMPAVDLIPRMRRCLRTSPIPSPSPLYIPANKHEDALRSVAIAAPCLCHATRRWRARPPRGYHMHSRLAYILHAISMPDSGRCMRERKLRRTLELPRERMSTSFPLPEGSRVHHGDATTALLFLLHSCRTLPLPSLVVRHADKNDEGVLRARGCPCVSR
ncbi:hypothetical protein B0H19DRAFT_426190 [Mycena capillaripes]|nr:hypothetical protein B0H19DRAFT_426190 [Mycena capillaripes]